MRCGEYLQEALCDDSELDVAMVGGDLASDGASVSIRFAVQVLVSPDAPYWRHGRHPEVVAIGADDTECLLEGQFDLESQAIDADDIQGTQCHVGGHQQDGAATRMRYGDEADEDADGSPEQVGGAKPEGDPLLAINGTGRFLELIGLSEQCCDQDLVAVLGGPSAKPRPVGRLGWGREVGHAVALDPRDEVVSLGQQAANRLAVGIVGVRHEVERHRQSQGVEQQDHLVQQSSLVAV